MNALVTIDSLHALASALVTSSSVHFSAIQKEVATCVDKLILKSAELGEGDVSLRNLLVGVWLVMGRENVTMHHG